MKQLPLIWLQGWYTYIGWALVLSLSCEMVVYFVVPKCLSQQFLMVKNRKQKHRVSILKFFSCHHVQPINQKKNTNIYLIAPPILIPWGCLYIYIIIPHVVEDQRRAISLCSFPQPLSIPYHHRRERPGWQGHMTATGKWFEWTGVIKNDTNPNSMHYFSGKSGNPSKSPYI